MPISFHAPASSAASTVCHTQAAAGNFHATRSAVGILSDALSGATEYNKILLRAAAGAGKSYALVRMVKEALDHTRCTRVAVTAFANKQILPLAGQLGRELGRKNVCLLAAAKRVPEGHKDFTVATRPEEIPTDSQVVLGTSHKMGVLGYRRRLIDQLGTAARHTHPFDVLMVDEAWQLPLHRFTTVEGLAPLVVGVGDAGQLPPLDPGQNPWRGDPGYNPYRAWPTEYDRDAKTFSVDLPAVWRPTAQQLPLWRAFYGDWDQLNCVAAPQDRVLELPALHGDASDIWATVATGSPTLLEVAGLRDPEAADIDTPLLGVIEDLLAPLVDQGFTVIERRYDEEGEPQGEIRVDSSKPDGDPLIVILATRNQTADDATDMVERLTKKFALPEGVLVASTVDSWQGQTNRITVAIHPLSGADQLDDFNSAFGRLAVTCTRATHGLLLVARAGLDDLLDNSPARPGTPLGEPGTRSLPRQTHQRILAAFRRGTLTL